MVKVSNKHTIGIGYNRECYHHPENRKLCIKVDLPGTPSTDSQREKKYYLHLLKRNVSWDMVPKYHGDIKTNIGLGSVYDLILNDDGSVSGTLENYLKANNDFKHVIKPFFELKAYLLQQRIIVGTLYPRNLLCQITEKKITKLVLCDDIGSSDFIPLCNYSRYFAEKKINRKWQQFEKRLINDYAIKLP